MARNINQAWTRDTGFARCAASGGGGLTPAPLASARAALGADVVDARGHRLGCVTDFALDLEVGVIAYAVVAYAVPGGAKRFAVPWVTLRHDRVRGCFVWDVERATLERSPGLPHGFVPGGKETEPEWSDTPCDFKEDRMKR